MNIAPVASFDASAYFKVPKPGEKAPQAQEISSSFNEMQTVFRENPSLQFGVADTVEESIGVAFTNVAQLANKTGQSGQLTAILKALKIDAPSKESLQSRDGISAIQKQVESRLQSMPRSDRDHLSNALSVKFDQLVHEMAQQKGGLIRISA